MTEPLTVVLVHGAFADASSWNGVVERLLAADVEVAAPANPLRGMAHDSAYIASFLEQIPGPVLAVGHSYGGAVISARVGRGARHGSSRPPTFGTGRQTRHRWCVSSPPCGSTSTVVPSRPPIGTTGRWSAVPRHVRRPAARHHRARGGKGMGAAPPARGQGCGRVVQRRHRRGGCEQQPVRPARPRSWPWPAGRHPSDRGAGAASGGLFADRA